MDTPLSKPLKDYMGRYHDPSQVFFIDVKLKEGLELKLEIAFKVSNRHHGDTFLCFHTSFNDLAK